MLRSLLNAPSFTFFTVKPKLTHYQFSTSSRVSNKLILKTGSISDVLAILSPLDQIFPATNLNPYLGFLKKCIKSGNFYMGSFVHSPLVKSGLKDEILISNVLLYGYTKGGCFTKAAKLFDEMRERDVVSWCTLISGYASYQLDFEAFDLFKRMMNSDLKPNQYVMSSILKCCAVSATLDVGLMIHGLIFKTGFGYDRFLEIGLVDMYGKCGDLGSALKLFYEIPIKSSVSWNAMISGYVNNGFLLNAVELSRDMFQTGVLMDLVTLRVVAYAAASLEMSNFCKNLHLYSMKLGFDKDTFLVSELVKLLSKLGEVEYMHELTKTVKNPDISLISVLISGYHLHGYRVEAVKLAKQLLASKSDPKQGAIVNVLNLCIYKEEGTQIHANILKSAQLHCISIWNALISTYVKAGEILDAKKIFFFMPIHDLVSWTAIITGLVQNLCFDEATKAFQTLRGTKLQLDQHSLTTIIYAYTAIQAIQNGQEIHALTIKLGFEVSNSTCASLIHMYMKCRCIGTAIKLFLHAPRPHSCMLINVMTAGYCWNLLPLKALEVYCIEYQTGFIPDKFTLATVLGACSDIKSLDIGEQVHCQTIKSGFHISDIVVGNATIGMYIKSGNVSSASKVFDCMRRRNMSSYQMLLMGYTQNKGRSEALRIFYRMQQDGFHANPVSFSRILRGCTDLAAIDLGKQIHAMVVKMGLVSDSYIGNALVGMYEKSKVLHEEATFVSNKQIVEDVVEAKFQIYEVPMLFHDVKSVLKLELAADKFLVDGYKINESLELSPNLVEKILENQVGFVYSDSKHGTVKYEVMQVEGIVSEHVILILILSDVSRHGFVDDDENFNRFSHLPKPGIESIFKSVAFA